jgi:hypothetical protein
MQVTRLNAVTLPSLSFKGITRLYLRFNTLLHQSETVSEADDGREPAFTARVINLEDKKEYEFICPALLISALARYGDYTGKCFEIECSKEPLPGKRYRGVECYEIADPEAEAE